MPDEQDYINYEVDRRPGDNEEWGTLVTAHRARVSLTPYEYYGHRLLDLVAVNGEIAACVILDENEAASLVEMLREWIGAK